MGHTKDSIHIDAPVDKVADFGADPQKWATVMTGMSGPDKTIGDGWWASFIFVVPLAF